MKKALLLTSGIAALALLAACSETTPRSAPTAPAIKVEPIADATPIIGNWCNATDGQYNISQTQFASNDGMCTYARLTNHSGTFSAGLVCENGNRENITITPVSGTLHITYLSRGGQRAIVRPC